MKEPHKTVLLVLQGSLALLFLFAGGMKLVIPADELTAQSSLSAPLLRFVGVCEVLGALGLVLPGLTAIRPQLTRLAAWGLVVIMVGATVTTTLEMSATLALFPFVVGLLTAYVGSQHGGGAPGV